jgi:cation diffusion facilitator CzcD-associated flavoprotein CzcO
VIVIGAGPAGLATGRELARRNIGYVIFERGSRAGHTWDTLYDSLVLHTGKHLSALPGLPFPGSTPLFPSRQDFLDYLQRYVDRFRLSIATGTCARVPS